MGQRPFEKQDWQARKYHSFSPYFRIDTGNPQMGTNGTVVYDFYGNNLEGDVSLVGMNKGGIFHIYNDRSIEIIGGQKSKETGVDICITGKNGDVWITAEKNGQVRVRGSSVVIDADENLTLRSGNNISIEASNKIQMKSNISNCDALVGNLPPKPVTFMSKVFTGTYVGEDIWGSLASTFL